MSRTWTWLLRWWRGTSSEPSLAAERARKRLVDTTRDDDRVERLSGEVRRMRRESDLGPAVVRALRAKRP